MSSHRYERASIAAVKLLWRPCSPNPAPTPNRSPSTPHPMLTELLRLLWLVYRARQADGRTGRRTGRQTFCLSVCQWVRQFANRLPPPPDYPLARPAAMLAALSVGKQARNRQQRPLFDRRGRCLLLLQRLRLATRLVQISFQFFLFYSFCFSLATNSSCSTHTHTRRQQGRAK